MGRRTCKGPPLKGGASMKRIVAGATFVSVVLGVGVLALQTGDRRSPGRVVSEDQLSEMREVPPALERHLERLRAIPGQGGESESPGGGEAQEFLAMAYPETDIPLARLSRARAAAERVQARGVDRDAED